LETPQNQYKKKKKKQNPKPLPIFTAIPPDHRNPTAKYGKTITAISLPYKQHRQISAPERRTVQEQKQCLSGLRGT